MATYQSGATIQGRYQVIQVLSGGMGIVYICVDQHEDGFPVALKTFQDRFISNAESRDRFLREATLWIQIGYHPNIVQAYKAIRLDDQSVFLVLQLVPRLPGAADASLRSALVPGSPMHVDRALQLGLQICRGMSYATSKVPGLVHRDIKSENILIAPDGTARITDFGLATVPQSASQQINKASFALPFNHAQITHGVVGTPLYISPEQWTTGSAGARSDIYAVGLVLFEAITGSYPFEAHTLDEIVESHLKGAPLWSLQMSQLEPALKQLLEGFLSPNPASRVSDWASAINALTRAHVAILHSEPTIEDAPIDVSRKTILLSAESFLAVGASYADIGQFAIADEYFLRARNIAKAEENLPLLARALGNSGVAKAGLGDNKSAIPMYATAIDIYIKLGFVASAGNNLANMGNSYFLTGDIARAHQCLSQALDIAQEARDSKNAARCQASLANIAIAGGDFHAALAAFRAALGAAQANSDVSSEAKYLGGMGLALEGLGDNSAAIHSYTLALEKARQIADRQTEASVLVAAGSLVGQSGDTSRGIPLIEEGLTLSTQIGDHLSQARAAGNLGMLYLKSGAFEIAQKLLEESLRTAKAIHAQDVLARAHWALGQLHEVKRDYHDAVTHQREAVILYKELGLPSYAEASRHLLALRKKLGLV